MVIGTFHIPKGKSKAVKAGKGIDVAARYFVYKLYEATDRQRCNGRSCMGWESQRRPFPGRSSVDGSFSRI
jgi:hypothetical protein